MTTDTAAPNPTDKPEHHGSCSPARASQFEKARPHQNTTPISTLARRAPSSNLNMWEERIRPQKPQLSPCIPPFKKSIVHEKKGNTLKIPTQVTVCFRRVTDSDEASPRRAAWETAVTGRSCEEGVVLMLKWKWVGLYGHTLPTSLWISLWQPPICSFMDCLSGKGVIRRICEVSGGPGTVTALSVISVIWGCLIVPALGTALPGRWVVSSNGQIRHGSEPNI